MRASVKSLINTLQAAHAFKKAEVIHDLSTKPKQEDKKTLGSSIQIFQGYDVISPKGGKAYPILCEEWNYLKQKVGSISENQNIYYSIGFLLLGSCISTLITICTGNFPCTASDMVSSKLIIAWAIVAVTLSISVICFYFAKEQNKIRLIKTSDILSQMELIEKRYQNGPN